MKKILMKTLMVLGIAAFGILAGSVLLPSGAHAQGFGAATDAGAQFGLAGGSLDKSGATNSLIGVVKNFINWILGLLSIIALGMSLYGGFKMVTAAGDDGKYKEGFKVLKQAAIGLVVVGLSWIIVSSIFAVLGTVGAGTTGAAVTGK